MVRVLLPLHHAPTALPAGQRHQVPPARQEIQHQRLRLLQAAADGGDPGGGQRIHPVPSNKVEQQGGPRGEAGLQDPAEVLRPREPLPLDAAVEAQAGVI